MSTPSTAGIRRCSFVHFGNELPRQAPNALPLVWVHSPLVTRRRSYFRVLSGFRVPCGILGTTSSVPLGLLPARGFLSAFVSLPTSPTSSSSFHLLPRTGAGLTRAPCILCRVSITVARHQARTGRGRSEVRVDHVGNHTILITSHTRIHSVLCAHTTLSPLWPTQSVCYPYILGRSTFTSGHRIFVFFALAK